MAIGTITGLFPGIHANTIAFIALILPIEKSLALALLIISMSITHSFVDAIPNILLGAASEENFLTIMPGQQMLLEERGIEAIQLTIFGGIITVLFAIIQHSAAIRLTVSLKNAGSSRLAAQLIRRRPICRLPAR